MKNSDNSGRLYLVGVGPGDPDLMTYRAVQVLEAAPVILAPKGSVQGSSSALATVKAQVDLEGKDVLELRFPMKRIYAARGRDQDREVIEAWNLAAETVLSSIDRGQDVAFPTIGDPAIYSTAFYLLATLIHIRPDLDVTIVPGISAMSACSAATRQPLGLGDELITVVPAAFDRDDLRQILEKSETTVLMKVHRRLEELTAILEETGLADNAILIERCGLPGQHIYHDIRQASGRELHYFSTMIISRNQRVFS
jgi:precorrin-2/cobalt-factor-2 C20-methyltransferase